MKRFKVKPILLMLAVTLALLFTSVIQASTVEVFSTEYTRDIYEGSGNLSNSGTATEEALIESILGVSDVSFTKIDDVSYESVPITGDYSLITDGIASVISLANNVTPESYFLLKFKNANASGFDSHYLFKNLDSLYNLVWINEDVNDLKLESLSHFVMSSVVPIPAGIWLFGTAILGLVGIRRRAIKTI